MSNQKAPSMRPAKDRAKIKKEPKSGLRVRSSIKGGAPQPDGTGNDMEG
jgi:hypothetical protein